MNSQFKVIKTQNPKQKPDPATLKFGTVFTDHMFVMDYDPNNGWHDGRIVPYGPIELYPAATVLQYSQQMFEGLKAYKTEDGRVLLFRPDMNAKRCTSTNERMCIPHIDEELFVDAVKAVVEVDRDWIPDKPGTSLYIRPFIIADEPFLGVRPSTTFKFMVILSPVGSYYGGAGLKPASIAVEDEYVRAVPGGTGFAKVGGNYAGALKAEVKAHQRGCDQVLWLDAITRTHVEEIGTSNAFFVIKGEVFTAPLNGTILPGITRNSAIALLKKWGVKVTERALSIEELHEAVKDGTLDEAFATGTAAVISPVGRFVYKNTDMEVGGGKVGPLAQKLYDTLYGIQTGKVKDDMGWTVEL